MPNTARDDERHLLDDEDDTLTEVGEEHDFELDDEVDPSDRRLDPLRQPK